MRRSSHYLAQTKGETKIGALHAGEIEQPGEVVDLTAAHMLILGAAFRVDLSTVRNQGTR